MIVGRPHEDKPHQVYVLYDATETPLYVGVTSNLKQRLREHRSTQPWWPDVDTWRATDPVSWETGLELEEQFIAELAPRHNKRKHNGSLYVRLGLREHVARERAEKQAERMQRRRSSS